ncbi:taste receptor type 2 member 8-like [Rana temporaria]|uniref:taste receptor type 2 member 8-like n=1 Tax=Rana temporaria TaxID=8407 RepID=UPI001AAD75FE|nr:taste receptor type 2 member 8-like [Rana temporaria]
MGFDPNSPAGVASLTVITLLAVTGIFMDLFILFVILQKGCRKKAIHSGDVIRTAIIISNIFVIVMMISSLFCFLFLSTVYHIIYKVIDVFTMCSISSSLYLTAIFSSFLFIKIAQFKSGVLAWVKRKVGLVIHWLVVAMEVISFICSLLSFLIFNIGGQVSTNNSTVSLGQAIAYRNLRAPVKGLIVASYLVPYFVMALTTISASGSLILHSHKMKKTATVNTEAYKRAVYRMMLFFTFHTLFSLFILLVYFVENDDLWKWVVLIIMFLLFAVHSLIIIYSSEKLRNIWKTTIGCNFCCKSFSQAENT